MKANHRWEPPKLKYYVYAVYLDSKTHPVYIGKGTGYRYRHYYYYPERISNRILRSKLTKLKSLGKKCTVEFLFETEDEQEALDVEEVYIQFFGRLFDRSGVLYNFEPGGLKGSEPRPKSRQAVYVDGFVFDSVGRAMEVTGIKHTTLQKYCEIGRAAYLKDEQQVERVRERERKMRYRNFYSRHKKAFRNAKKKMLISEANSGERNGWYGKSTAISRKIEVDGVVYSSITKAANAYGVSKGSSFKRTLERGHKGYKWRFI